MPEVDLKEALALLRRAGSVPKVPDAAPGYLQEVIDGLISLSSVDPLTGLGNRYRLDEELARQAALVERGRDAAVMMIDIDGFKRINDAHGHPVGDSVIRTSAKIIRQTIRDSDVPVRMGGEEFAVILPDATPRMAHDIAERVRRNFAKTFFGENLGTLTVSIGVSSIHCGEDAVNGIVRADACLYAAKRSGKNRVVVDHGEGREVRDDDH